MRGRTGVWGSTCFLLVLIPAVADAQAIPGEFEIAGGMRRIGTTSLGDADAVETRPGGGSFKLFGTESQLDGANAIEARIGVPLMRRFRLEASGSYATSDLSTRISADVEGSPNVTAVEPVRQFTLDASVVMDLPQWTIGRRVVPFVSAGAGYLREIHEGQTLIENGAITHIGGGTNVVLGARSGARVKAFGVRLHARAVLRFGGVAFDDGAHIAPGLGATAFVRF